MHGDRERFLGAGFDGYISKPVNVAELLAVVKESLQQRPPTSPQ
jgi:DNA-binding response OmpR family regulator